MKLIRYVIMLLSIHESFLLCMDKDEGRYCIDINKSVAAIKKHIERNDLEKMIGAFSIISLTMIPEQSQQDLFAGLKQNIAHQKQLYEKNIDYVSLIASCGMACYGAYQALAAMQEKSFYTFGSATVSLGYSAKLIHDGISNASGKKQYLHALAMKGLVTSPNNNSCVTKTETIVSILKPIKKSDVERFLDHTPTKISTFSCN